MAEPANTTGAGFYETFRTSGGRPHQWRYHQRRLDAACAHAGLALDSLLARDEPRLHSAVADLLCAHALPDAVFRYTVISASAASADCAAPTENLALRPLPPLPPPEGIALRVLNVARDRAEFLPRPKIANDPNVLAGTEELRRRAAAPSDEGLFLSRDGACVVETTRQALFWISGGTIRYADPALGGVAGTCLAWVLEHPLAAAPARASLADLLSAEAIAVCNAVRGVTPVREIWDAADRSLLRSLASASHPLLTKLTAAWDESLRMTAGETK